MGNRCSPPAWWEYKGGCCLTHPFPYDPHHHSGALLPARAPQRQDPRGKEKGTPSPTNQAISTQSLAWSPLRASTTLANMSLAKEGLWRAGQLTPYAPLLSPLLPPSGWGWKITGSKFLVLNSPFSSKTFPQKELKRWHLKAKKSQSQGLSPNLGVPTKRQWRCE